MTLLNEQNGTGMVFPFPAEKERKIIMKKRISSFLAGAAAALTLSVCLTTAMAAAGKVTYNFANVALDGNQKITAGQDITAANGQKVPGSILYTDEAGGKTNYLPIRAISELLGVEIGYNSATKTVLLGKQPTSGSESSSSTGDMLAGYPIVNDEETGEAVFPDGVPEIGGESTGIVVEPEIIPGFRSPTGIIGDFGGPA